MSWPQEVGGSSIEASKIAGHADLNMTRGYTRVGIARREELARPIQGKLSAAARKETTPPGAPTPAPESGATSAALPSLANAEPATRMVQ